MLKKRNFNICIVLEVIFNDFPINLHTVDKYKNIKNKE
jgi:hypothetical protein